jgi:thiamine-monophosphate kinase
VEAGEQVGGLGEFALLRQMLPRFPQSPSVLVGPGDDAAVVQVPGVGVVASVDVLVDGVHFRRAWFDGSDVGFKAAAVNMADIAAMGARPLALLVGLVAPADLPLRWLTAFSDGLRDCAEPLGCSVVGGDTVEGPMLAVAVTALGALDGPVVTRAGARPGDVLAIHGRLGWAAAGLAVLQRGFRSPRLLVDAQRRPQPPYAAGPEAAAAGATAMIDVSDGLLADAQHLAEASGVQVVVDAGQVVVDPPLEQMGPALGVDPLTWVLGGGEDHALLACFPATMALAPGWRAIGHVDSGEGVRLEGVPEGSDLGRTSGYQHFSR